MKEAARKARAEGGIVGLVPTMGALHAGHLSLVRRAQQDCRPVVVSVFVNPAQFGPKEDFSKYPRALESRTYVDVEGLSDRFEGRSRPGHFRGVTTVVLKLLEIVQPQFAYFGRKDAQQARIIRQMARDLNLDSEIVVCPIVREADGLAMSSRNAYLNPEERQAATVLRRALEAARTEVSAGTRDALRLQAVMRRALESEPLASTDYAEIVDAESFEPVTRVSRECYALLAVFVGATRLLDNMLIRPAPEGGDDFHFEL